MASIFTQLIPIDFEFNKSKDKKMNVVSVAYEVDGVKFNRWLHKNEEEQKAFKDHIGQFKNSHILLGHNQAAEARSFLSIGLKPLEYKWICTFTEQRCISNHNDEMMYGSQLINGRIIHTHRKEYDEDPSIYTSKPEHSLAATTYKMLGTSISLTTKDTTRDLIISAPEEFTAEEKEQILAYGESDIDNLAKIYRAQLIEYKRLLGNDFNMKELVSEQILRGEAMVRTAMMEEVGYPINFKAVKNFALNTDNILGEIAADCNRQFPDIMPFAWDRSLNRYKVDTKAIGKWIEESEYASGWPITKRGYSLAREEWEKRFGNGHVFKEGNFGSQMYRYFYTKQHMNGFQSTKGKKKTFWDSVGRDLRVRPWLNPYRAQSSRYQPAATGFIPLKAAWMRSLIQPKAGRACAAIDYGSEEFLISALWSGDEEMYKAYLTGDVYLAFAKSAGMVPQDATKKSHVKERQIAKAIVLGISYGLTKFGLADDLGCSKEEAQAYIDLFNSVYHVFHAKCVALTGKRGYNEAGQWIETFGSYKTDGRLKLPCGWYLWGDNDNMRSVGNCPIQGFGASIIRKAVALCQDAGLQVMYPLHDAVYIEFEQTDYEQTLRTFKQCMLEAFVFYFEGEQAERAKNIRMDFEVWGFDKEQTITVDGEEIHCETIHIDERHTQEYHQFSKYFEDDADAMEL